MKYLIDSNALIDAYNKWYQPKIFPSLWPKFANSSKFLIISSVYKEITWKDDGLSKWLIQNFKKRVIPETSNTLKEYYKIIKWIRLSKIWNETGIRKWDTPSGEKADPWLIATAKLNHQEIVTFDGGNRITLPPKRKEYSRRSKQEPKISGVAYQLGVKTIPMYILVGKLGIKL